MVQFSTQTSALMHSPAGKLWQGTERVNKGPKYCLLSFIFNHRCGILIFNENWPHGHHFLFHQIVWILEHAWNAELLNHYRIAEFRLKGMSEGHAVQLSSYLGNLDPEDSSGRWQEESWPHWSKAPGYLCSVEPFYQNESSHRSPVFAMWFSLWQTVRK